MLLHSYRQACQKCTESAQDCTKSLVLVPPGVCLIVLWHLLLKIWPNHFLFCVVSTSFCHHSLSLCFYVSHSPYLPFHISLLSWPSHTFPLWLMSNTCLHGTSQAHPLSVSSMPCSLCEQSSGERVSGYFPAQLYVCVRVCFFCM